MTKIEQTFEAGEQATSQSARDADAQSITQLLNTTVNNAEATVDKNFEFVFSGSVDASLPLFSLWSSNLTSLQTYISSEELNQNLAVVPPATGDTTFDTAMEADSLGQSVKLGEGFNQLSMANGDAFFVESNGDIDATSSNGEEEILNPTGELYRRNEPDFRDRFVLRERGDAAERGQFHGRRRWWAVRQ